MGIAGKRDIGAGIAPGRRAGRLAALALLATAVNGHAVTITHNAYVYFCHMTGKVHGVCQDEIRNGGAFVAALDKGCKLTRETAGGPGIAVAENRQRVNAVGNSSEMTTFDIPVAARTRYCTFNNGKYMQWSVLGLVRVAFQPSGSGCANYTSGIVL